MKVTCIIVPTATQTAKEKDKTREKSQVDEYVQLNLGLGPELLNF